LAPDTPILLIDASSYNSESLLRGTIPLTIAENPLGPKFFKLKLSLKTVRFFKKGSAAPIAFAPSFSIPQKFKFKSRVESYVRFLSV